MLQTIRIYGHSVEGPEKRWLFEVSRQQDISLRLTTRHAGASAKTALWTKQKPAIENGRR
jgi:hypothetical protein